MPLKSRARREYGAAPKFQFVESVALAWVRLRWKRKSGLKTFWATTKSKSDPLSFVSLRICCSLNWFPQKHIAELRPSASPSVVACDTAVQKNGFWLLCCLLTAPWNVFCKQQQGWLSWNGQSTFQILALPILSCFRFNTHPNPSHNFWALILSHHKVNVRSFEFC